jgi:uncharacterized protein (TIGR02246 family)
MSEETEDAELGLRVQRLLQNYADAIDRGDAAAVAALFSADGRWDHDAATQLQGRAAILHHLRQGLPRFAQAHHHVGPARIERLADGALQSTAYFIATHVLRGGESYTVWGRYVDRIDEGAELQIAQRQTVVHLSAGTDREYTLLQRVPLPD